jgi:uncharacterized membrane protein
MTLEPLLEASALVQVHVATATAAVVLGAVQFVAPKGLLPHRAIGWTWVGLMTVMVISALLNQDFLEFGPFSPKLCCGPDGPCLRGYVCAGTHIWTVSCLLALPYAVQHARLHHVQHHRNAMPVPILRHAHNHGYLHIRAQAHHARDRVRDLGLINKPPRCGPR